ncbi:MAG TPA: hypothetical protein VFS71_16745, partial [Flavobacterium sp.]|nr:hypothetical protein [Flavobacterium sp.]
MFFSCQQEELSSDDSVNGEAAKKTDIHGHAYGTITSEMVLRWNEAGTEAVANVGNLPPMPESRIYAMVNVAMHDALNNIVPRYQTYALKNARDKDADANAAVAQAAHDVIVDQLPPQQVFADNLLNVSLASIADGNSKTKGIALGKAAAKAILDLRANDGAATAQTAYVQGTL